MINLEAYEALRRRPEGRSSMRQEWADLLFAHYALDPALVQPLLPAGLTLDLYPDADGIEQAWIGVVPFAMRQIRPTGLPAVPWLSAFLEANVRTYVVHEDGRPGVWFFSLDAARWLACAYARTRFHLPYTHAMMSLRRTGDIVEYEVSRRGNRHATLSCRYEIGPEVGTATPGTFEFWLVERYVLYSVRGGQLFTGRVHHVPYPLRTVVEPRLETTLPEAVGLPQRPFTHWIYSPGVDVEVFTLEVLKPA